MLFRMSLLSVLVPFVSALSLSTPTNWTSGGPVTFTWTTSAGDNPLFSLELSNPIIFNQALALANNVDVSLQTLSFTLPIVPATSGYILQAVNLTNINDVFAQSGSFSVGETISSSALPSSASVSGSVSGSGSASAPVTISPASTTPFGSTVKASSTPTAPGSASGSGASSASSPAPSSFNGNGALSNLNLGYGSWAVMGLGAVFGVMATL